MMKLRRVLSLLLAAASLAALLVLPSSAAGKSAFADITDPAVAEAAEVLRLLGVVDGIGTGIFNPGKNLTRAEFCKMTVEIMGKGDQEPAQRGRTIFLDVGPTHWARGYINLASSITLGGGGDGENAPAPTRLIMGVGDGTFEPNRVITYGEAVAILVRVMGYGTGDVATGMPWYDGYLAIGKESGLLDGLSLDGSASLNRGQAAILFYNLLFTKPKGSSDIYLTTLGGSKADGGILLDVDATAPDGTKGAVKTTTGTYKTDRAAFPATMEGSQGDVLLDKDGKLLAFQSDKNVSSRSVNVSEWAYNYVTDSNKNKLDVDPEADVYVDGTKKAYKDIYLDQRSGAPLTIYYSADGNIAYLFLRSASVAETAMVAKNKPNGTTNPFGSLVSRVTDYQIYKNGVPATVADIRQYDVATYDANTKVLQISDLRLTGVYENVYPNTSTPAEITMMGAKFKVLSSAAADLRSFRPGDKITLLMTVDGQVAGVVSGETLRSNTLGVITEISEGGQATVKPLSTALPEFSGQSSYTGNSAVEIKGQLVTVSSSSAGHINLARLPSTGTSSSLNVGARKLGNIDLAPNVVIFERVNNSMPQRAELEDITCNTVPADKILYAGRDYAGRIGTLILDDVTGDRYTYGSVTFTGAVPGEGMDPGINATVSVTNSAGGLGPVECGGTFSNGSYMGIVATVDGKKLAGSVELNKLTGISKDAFDMEAKTVSTPDMVLPLADNVQCYNRTTHTWFGNKDTDPMEAVNLARAFSDNLTIYYDKAPEDGGKIRIIVAN